MNKKEREENFAFGTTDQSNSQREALLMRAVQEEKGGRTRENERGEKNTPHHSYTEREMNRFQSLVEDVAVCVGGGA